MKIEVELEKLIEKLGSIGLSHQMAYNMLLKSSVEFPICITKGSLEKCIADIILWSLVYSKIKNIDIEYYVNKLLKEYLDKLK